MGTLKWFVGAGPRPRYGRWTYWEKFDYFAVFWGIFVIGSTGLMLWFPEFFTRLLPGLADQRGHDHPQRRGAARHRLHLHGALLQHAPAAREVPDGHVIFTGRMPVEEFKRRQAGGVRGAGGEREARGEPRRALSAGGDPHDPRLRLDGPRRSAPSWCCGSSTRWCSPTASRPLEDPAGRAPERCSVTGASLAVAPTTPSARPGSDPSSPGWTKLRGMTNRRPDRAAIRHFTGRVAIAVCSKVTNQ